MQQFEDIPLGNSTMPGSGSSPAPVPVDHLLSPAQKNVSSKSSAGPLFGIVIILGVLILGALYFWGAHLNAQKAQDQVPLIPADNSTQAGS